MRWHRWIFSLCLILCAAGFGRDRFDLWIDATRLPPLVDAVSTEVTDRHGVLLRVYPVEDGIWRMATRVDQVDPDFIDMLVTIEDKRFFSHAGVDLWALSRAAAQALWHGRVVSGGSTLTMQTARLLENSGTGDWRGKLRQMRVALALERRLSKDQILAQYLTHAPYGGNLEGVRAASLAWFGKPPRRLDQDEAALLVALPQSPTTRRPDRHPATARAARDRILARIGKPESFKPPPSKMLRFPAEAPLLADRVRRDSPDADVLKTTLDRQVQKQAKRLADRAMDALPDGGSVSIVVVDHLSGEGRAYVGSGAYGGQTGAGYVDMVQAKRSPGSTLKPLIYALAMDQGLVHPETLITDAPVSFEGYAPQNFDGFFRGDVSVRSALQQSLNIPPVMLTHAMGPARLMAGLRKSGANPVLPGGKPGLAVALGGVGVSLEDLVHVYAGLAQGGQTQTLSWVARADPEPEGQAFVSPVAAWHVGHILAGNLPNDGSAIGQIAFKTGTSYGYRDAWALGWDGRHVVGVWLGRPDGTPVPGLFGGDWAAPIVFEMFSRLKTTPDPLPRPPPTALLLANDLLPKPLQRFGASSVTSKPGVKIAFPPNGATLRASKDGAVLMKLKGGQPPFAIMSNGRPIKTGQTHSEFTLTGLRPGTTRLQALDASGSAHSVDVRID